MGCYVFMILTDWTEIHTCMITCVVTALADMLSARAARWVPLMNRYAEMAPTCCNACRTCTTTNVLNLAGLVGAAAAAPFLRAVRRVRPGN